MPSCTQVGLHHRRVRARTALLSRSVMKNASECRAYHRAKNRSLRCGETNFAQRKMFPSSGAKSSSRQWPQWGKAERISTAGFRAASGGRRRPKYVRHQPRLSKPALSTRPKALPKAHECQAGRALIGRPAAENKVSTGQPFQERGPRYRGVTIFKAFISVAILIVAVPGGSSRRSWHGLRS